MLEHNVETPENKTPLLYCERCKTVTRHTFGHKQPATALEDDRTTDLIFICDVCCETRRYGRESR